MNPTKEQLFLRTVFQTPRTNGPLCLALQKSLGIDGKRADGRWGPMTRTRFVATATAHVGAKPLRVTLPRVGPADLVFETRKPNKS
jgi:hypothetical protein